MKKEKTQGALLLDQDDVFRSYPEFEMDLDRASKAPASCASLFLNLNPKLTLFSSALVCIYVFYP